ncbi:hypothetical protein SKAU_G00077270 [Synaphobranchus kaupii]|uniref:RING-type E3 ubiquitin transferase n=1 Tax=Synaphobranchus kaupii TaxID=118154 RepID=A0A9Q1JCC0_SYNKA|nr:hypothetical protein SKAU_G00077270 [Synaphobranchus kaupii]
MVHNERYRVVVSYPPQSEAELELKEGDIVFVHKKREDGWFKGTLQRNGRTGLFPGSFVLSINTFDVCDYDDGVCCFGGVGWERAGLVTMTTRGTVGPSSLGVQFTGWAVMSELGVVFGGSRGIGRAVSQLLAARGHRVAVVSRNLEAAQAAVSTLAGGGHLALSCDVSREQDVQEAFKKIQKSCGNVHYLVNAAGVNRDGLLLRMGQEDMVSLLHTNLLGTMLTCRAALRSLLHKQGGAIVNIGSVVGQKGHSGQCVYSATKAGLEGFTRSLAKEVASRNIRVNLVAPGFIRTDMTAGLQEEELIGGVPLARFGEPEEVALAVLFLLETPYVTGQVLQVDGGLRLAM